MGVCLSCLGLRGHNGDDIDRQRLLYDDYPTSQQYGTWSAANTIPPEDLMTPEEIEAERTALDKISRNLSDHIVEIFPHNLNFRSLAMSTSQLLNGSGHGIEQDDDTDNQHGSTVTTAAQQQDILLTLVPGDKSKRSIRIYPTSRPTSKNGQSLRSKNSLAGGMNGAGSRKKGDTSILVALDVNLP